MKYLSRLVEVNGLKEYNRTYVQHYWLNSYQKSENETDYLKSAAVITCPYFKSCKCTWKHA